MGWLLLEWSKFLVHWNQIKDKRKFENQTNCLLFSQKYMLHKFTNSWQHYFSITLLKYSSIAYHFLLISNNFSSDCNAWCKNYWFDVVMPDILKNSYNFYCFYFSTAHRHLAVRLTLNPIDLFHTRWWAFSLIGKKEIMVNTDTEPKQIVWLFA